jgi:hypothetical protein
MSANGEWYLANEALDKRWARSGKEIAMLFRTGEVQPWLNFDNWSPANLYFSSGRARFSPNSQYLAVGSNTGIVALMHLPSLKREIDAYDRLLTNAEKP